MQYTPSGTPGSWAPDPLNPGQEAWGPNWGNVTPFALQSGSQFRPGPPPAFNSAQFENDYNEVKALGSLNSSVRTSDQTEAGIFWAYDRTGIGPPPLLFISVAQQVATQQGNTEADNVRYMGMISVALADAGIASWDSKYEFDLGRPVTIIRQEAEELNSNLEEDPNWVPLGAPGDDPNSSADDFTPPFPTYTSGHATFGEAMAEAMREFYGTDEVSFTLESDELPGVMRDFESFSEMADENGRSRVYLGIHFDFDSTVGQDLGEDVAQYIFANNFQQIPEPGVGLMLGMIGLLCHCSRRRRRHLV